MRTTVTLEPDVQNLLKQAMHDTDASFKQVVNDAIRKGLRPAAAGARRPFVQTTFDSGRQLVDLTKANALADELEDQDLVAKLQDGR
jgi:uncharacterized protein (DUF924 family)